MNVMKRFMFTSQNSLHLYRNGIIRLFSEKPINFDLLVKEKPVVVFMKGTPDAPRCGFSNAVCQILRFHGVNDFSSHDVLADDAIRTGVKEYTEWPTIPQIFFNGEFIGGCDILLEMHKNGDLIEELKKIGIRSTLLDAKPEEDGGKS